MPLSKPRDLLKYFRLCRLDEDFRALLGVDIESVDPVTAGEETPERADGRGDRTYTDRWGILWRMPKDGHYFDLSGWPLADAQSVSDVERFAWPQEDSEGLLGNLGPDAAVVWKNHRRAVVLGRTAPGMFEMLAYLCGHEKAMLDLALNPELSEALLDKVLELRLVYYRSAIRRLLDAGVEYFIAMEADDLGSQRGLLISPDMYRTIVKPRHSQLFRAIKEMSGGRAFICLHCCGAVREIIPDLIESGVELLNPVQFSADGMDLTGLKRDFGDSLVFYGGGVNTQTTLVKGTPMEVRDEVRCCMDVLAPGGGFIFTPVHSIQHDVPFENFEAMLNAYREFAA